MRLASIRFDRTADHPGRVEVTLTGSRADARRAPLTLQLQLNLGAAA